MVSVPCPSCSELVSPTDLGDNVPSCPYCGCPIHATGKTSTRQRIAKTLIAATLLIGSVSGAILGRSYGRIVATVGAIVGGLLGIWLGYLGYRVGGWLVTKVVIRVRKRNYYTVIDAQGGLLTLQGYDHQGQPTTFHVHPNELAFPSSEHHFAPNQLREDGGWVDGTRERRTRQFEHYLGLMAHRALHLVKCDCFVIFSAPMPWGKRVWADGVEHDTRFVQFAFDKNYEKGFYFELPNTTLTPGETARAISEPRHFKQQFERAFHPIVAEYEYHQLRRAAEDAAYVFFDLYQCPVDAWIKVKASTFGDEEWERDFSMG